MVVVVVRAQRCTHVGMDARRVHMPPVCTNLSPFGDRKRTEASGKDAGDLCASREGHGMQAKALLLVTGRHLAGNLCVRACVRACVKVLERA